MTDLRTAAQQALEALEFMADEWGFTQKANRPERWQAIGALRAALAQQEQEPVAWMLTDDSGMRFVSVDRPHPDFVPLYTAPPRREWRGLTDDEISALFPLPLRSDYKPYSFARAIEAALKEKNHE